MKNLTITFNEREFKLEYEKSVDSYTIHLNDYLSTYLPNPVLLKKEYEGVYRCHYELEHRSKELFGIITNAFAKAEKS